MHVGDIANCYHELNHDGCLDGVAWGLSKMPQCRAAAIVLPVCLFFLHVNSDLKETLYQIPPPTPHRAKPPGLALEP